MRKLLVITVSAILGIFGWATSLISIFKTGVGWDSVFDLDAAKITKSMQGFESLQEFYNQVPLTSEFYGVLIYKLADFLSLFSSNTSIYQDTSLLKNFYYIDLVTWLISLFSILIITIIIFFVSKSILFAATFFGLISTLPIWVGMSQINSKDIPVAAGISIVSSGFMILFKYSLDRMYYFLGIIVTSLGAGIAIAVRPASVTIVFVLIIMNTLIIFIKDFKLIYSITNFLLFILVPIIIIILSLIITFYSNYIPIEFFFTWIQDAIKVSFNFPSIQPVKLFGLEFISNELPRWYVIAWVWAQLPVLVFVAVFVGLILWLLRIFNNMHREFNFMITPFFLQAMLVPLYIFFNNINIYNGIRHILFIYPALIMFGAFASLTIIQSKKILNWFGITFFILIIFTNIFATFRWSPYSYAFINPIAGLGNQRNWDLDFWGLSSREGVERLRLLTKTQEVIVMPDSSSSIPFGGLNTYSIPDLESPFNLYVYIHWNHKIVEPDCEILFRIKRDNQTLGMGGTCFKLAN
jgi:hypothetical protein